MKKQLRKCNAYVLTDSDCEFITAFHIEIAHEDRVFYLPNHDERNAHTLLALISYNSLVAVYDCDCEILFLLPRWDYSVTTQSHIRKFVKDYLNTDICKYDIEHNCVLGMECIICSGYENGTAFIQTH